ncbi:hypothetical protein KIPB_006790 [Kipferlia bialata]|uniref:Uncharacterized protein n=1 Tax=Kipferlia bialata TaxID=797122 RepID=A0A9K3CZ20_9EUKA|nr:hypothetical protein KIPB_006790 [Kipferlia bialata]|eukprot:g6790.t1
MLATFAGSDREVTPTTQEGPVGNATFVMDLDRVRAQIESGGQEEWEVVEWHCVSTRRCSSLCVVQGVIYTIRQDGVWRSNVCGDVDARGAKGEWVKEAGDPVPSSGRAGRWLGEGRGTQALGRYLVLTPLSRDTAVHAYDTVSGEWHRWGLLLRSKYVTLTPTGVLISADRAGRVVTAEPDPALLYPSDTCRWGETSRVPASRLM